MKKQELLNMTPLLVTPEIQKLVEDDKLVRKKSIYGNHTYIEKNYQRKMYLRCVEEGGILKVGIFLPDYIRTGSTLPSFEVFISKNERRFLTYDRAHGRWLTGKLDRIEFPDYVYYEGKRWIEQADSDIIQDYLGTKKGGYEGVLEYQREIREAELLARHKKETDPWDEDLKQIPPLPKDWLKWVEKNGIPEHFIYYHYKKRGAKVGYCTHCGCEVPIKKPRNNKKGRCPRCRHGITYKAVGKAGTVWTGRYTAYLLQRCRDGFVIRKFKVRRKHPRNGKYKEAEVFAQEIRRVIYSREMEARAYYWGVYKQRYERWISYKLTYLPIYRGASGLLYGKTLPDLARKELKKTGLPEWVRYYTKVDPEWYLEAYRRRPQLEKFTKAGLWKLAEECMKTWYDSQEGPRFYVSSSLTGILGIHPQGLKRIRQNNGGYRFLGWLQYEISSGKRVPDDLINWFCKQDVSAHDLDFVLDKMSPIQIRNYLTRQMHEMNWGCSRIVNTWADYLAMAKRLKMNINDEIIYRVRKLKQRHDELVKICQEREPELRLMEMKEKYPNVDLIYKTLKKYEYKGKDYSVLVPSGMEEILAEGDALHHCASTQERYWERIERRESYILFLRKNTELKKSYYTLEVEPNGTVRQKRTEFDRHGKDIEEVKKFLLEWQAVIAKRISVEDRILAKNSQVLRLENFAELREKQAIIHTGDLAGKKLVDVLMADLMPAAA